MTGNGLEIYSGNPGLPEHSIWSSAPVIPHGLNDRYGNFADDEDARIDGGPTHGFDPPEPKWSDIAPLVANGQTIIINGNHSSSYDVKYKKPRKYKKLGCAAIVLVGISAAAAGIKFFPNSEKPDLCTNSKMGFPEETNINSVELCIPANGVLLGPSNDQIAVRVETHFNMRNGAAAPNTLGDLSALLNSGQPSADIARQSSTNAAGTLMSALANSEGGAIVCESVLNSLKNILQSEASYLADNQLTVSGTQPMSADQIRSATNVRLITRYEVEGQGNDEGREIVCS